MHASKIKIWVWGHRLFPLFKQLPTTKYEIAFEPALPLLADSFVNQDIICVDASLQQALKESPPLLLQAMRSILLLFSQEIPPVLTREKALKDGFVEIFLPDISVKELTAKLTIYGNMHKAEQPENTGNFFDQQILDASPAAVRIIDLNKKIRYTNQKYDQLNHTIKEEIIGKNCSSYFCAWLCNTDDCAVNKIIKENKPYFFEHTTSVNNHYIFDIRPFKNLAGKTTGVIESIIDITHLKKGQKALEESEDRFKIYIENSPVGIILFDDWGSLKYANKAFCSLTGYSLDELTPLTLQHLVKKKQAFFSLFSSLKKHQRISKEQNLAAKHKTNIPIMFDAVMLEPNNYLAFCTDIRQLKNTQTRLNEYKNKLEILLNQQTEALKIQKEKLSINYKISHEGVWDYHINSEKMFFSPAFYTMLGYKPYEFEQDLSVWQKLIHHEDINMVRLAFQEFLTNREDAINLELRLKTKTGKYKWIRTSGIALETDNKGNKTRVVGTNVDIQSEKRTLFLLIKSETKYKKLVEQLNDWIWEIDENEIYNYSSPHVINILGYSSDEIVGKTPYAFMPQKRINTFKTLLENYTDKKEPFSGIIVKNYHKNGKLVYLESSGTPVFNEQGNFTGYMGIHRDVTERIRIEQSIIESEEQFRKIYHTTADLIFITTQQGNILSFNNASALLFKEEKISLLHTNILQLFNAKKLVEYFEEFKTTKLNVAEIYCSINNAAMVFELNGRIIPYKGKKAILNVFKDITEHKALERKVLQTVIETEEKERARFAKDLHDGLGPQLSAIRLYVNSLSIAAYSDDKKKQMIDNAIKIIDNAITSTREVANNLMPSVLENFGLIQAIHLFCDDVSEINKIHIQLSNNGFDENLPKNKQIVLYRVISELINNTIRHANAQQIRIEFFMEQNISSVRYTDNGKGFDLGQRKIGNGLENIKSRIKSINGSVFFESSPKQGTQVTINV